MNKYASIYNFFNSFGIPFYVNTSVPNDAQYPYGTYENITGSEFDQVSVTVRLYYYSTKESEINAMVEKISKSIGLGGTQILCENGSIWITKGTPFCQAIADESDTNFKSRYILLNFDFFTE